MSAENLEVRIDKFIFRVKPEVGYTELGVWVAMDEASGIARLGLSDFRQQSSGDVAFVDLPAEGDHIVAGKELATIETIKVDLEVPAPFDGQVVAANESLQDSPELINQDWHSPHTDDSAQATPEAMMLIERYDLMGPTPSR